MELRINLKKTILVLLLAGTSASLVALIYAFKINQGNVLTKNNLIIGELSNRYPDGSKAEAIPTASGSTYLDTRDNNVQLDLRQEYFDDLNALWGTSAESGEFIGEAFDSEYATRSAPRPVSHPIEIKQEDIAIRPAKGNEVESHPFVDDDPLSLENRVINENYKKYGELIGSFFSNWGQTINRIEEADVDKDGIPEKLITTSNIGANHPPHHAYVVKDNVIIASVELISGYIKPAKDGNGFYVKDPDPAGDWGEGMSYLSPLCCPMGYRIYRVVYEDSRFVPVWEQDVIYLQFKEPK